MATVFFPQYRKGRQGIEAFRGTVLEHARRLGLEIASECGGLGTCGRCIVRIEKGEECLGEKTAHELEHRLVAGERLACQAELASTDQDIYIFIRDFGDYSILSETVETDVELDPCVRREGSRVVHRGEGDLGPYDGEIYGLAIDVGTTTVVMQVVDLEDGCVVATRACKNPQIAYGNDIISRIGHTMTAEHGLQEMQAAVMGAVNDMLDAVEGDVRQGPVRKYIYDVVAVGNSTMRDVFFGRDVKTLGVLPFEPMSCAAVSAKAGGLGLSVHSGALAYGPALIGGQAGADALVDILACGMHEDERLNMMIDIGTNGEVALGNRDRLITVSCAAGGAYEGSTTRCGIGAISGAIKNVWISSSRAHYETIDGKPPVGVCGSGLIDLLAEMLRAGIMTKKARIEKPFPVTGKISIDQQDIFQLITAKASLRTDQDLILEHFGATVEDLSHIYLSGGFGNYINSENAVAIGLLVPAPDKVVRIGNGALAGARMLLLSRVLRGTAEDLASSVEHMKVNETEPDFAYRLADSMYF